MTSTPSQRIWAAWDEVMSGPGVEGYLPERPHDPMTLARVAVRIRDGVALRNAVADFVDDMRWARDAADVAARVAEKPVAVSREVDAYLAALAEHFCCRREIPAPAWSLQSTRFLDRFWFPSNTPALDARAVVESPAAFRRRGIFIGAGSLQRV